MNFVWAIICSVIAGMLTPKINIPSMISKFIKARSNRYKMVLENDAIHLLNHPIEEINMRISSNTLLISWLLIFAMSILYILYKDSRTQLNLFSRFIGYSPAIILFMISFYFCGRFIRYSTILSEVDKQRRKKVNNTSLY